jgi:hypothetical protein|mmetsp:Transcript_94083/g.148760  ORF Transcript_94083/g.148760 Transcript_94083/m.148760 type:complete len:344 (-) Transcript_94083:511-1542(-)
MMIGFCVPAMSFADFRNLLARRNSDKHGRKEIKARQMRFSNDFDEIIKVEHCQSPSKNSDVGTLLPPTTGDKTLLTRCSTKSKKAIAPPAKPKAVVPQKIGQVASRPLKNLLSHKKLGLPRRLKEMVMSFQVRRASDVARTSQRLTAGSCRSNRVGETLIIFDWDDTLLNSSFVMKQRQGWTIPESIKSHFNAIEQRAYQLLEIALGLGHTYIITNAKDGWVEQSAARYMPSLLPILERVEIISARSTQEATCNGDISLWKVKAFMEIGQYFDVDIVTNVVSIGDSDFELDAAHILGKRFSKSFTKTIKLQENPTTEEHMKQLGSLVLKLQDIVNEARNLVVA